MHFSSQTRTKMLSLFEKPVDLSKPCALRPFQRQSLSRPVNPPPDSPSDDEQLSKGKAYQVRVRALSGEAIREKVTFGWGRTVSSLVIMLEVEWMGFGGRMMWDTFSESAQGYKEVKCKSDQPLQICIDTLEAHNRDATHQITITFFPEAIDDLSAIVRVIGIEWRDDLKQLAKQCNMQHQSPGFVIYDGLILFPLQLDDLPNLVIHCDALSFAHRTRSK
jgi:hypothetical protein